MSHGELEACREGARLMAEQVDRMAEDIAEAIRLLSRTNEDLAQRLLQGWRAIRNETYTLDMILSDGHDGYDDDTGVDVPNRQESIYDWSEFENRQRYA